MPNEMRMTPQVKPIGTIKNDCMPSMSVWMAGQAPIGKREKDEPMPETWHSRSALREDLSLRVSATQQSRPARRNHVREWAWSYRQERPMAQLDEQNLQLMITS